MSNGTITIEDVVKQIADIQTAIAGGVPDKDKLKAELGEWVKQLVALQVQEKMDAQPQRRASTLTVGARQLIGPDGAPISKSNRYYGMLKDFAEGRAHRSGFAKVKEIDLWLTFYALQKAHRNRPDSAPAPSADLQAAVKALTSTGSGTGDELVPTDMAERLWEDFYLASRVAAQMTAVPMSSNPFDIPLSLGSVTWRKGTQNTATTHSDPATGKSVLTATELVTEQQWSYTMQEDAIAAFMPGLRARLAQSGGEIIDDFALNADATNAGTGNINSDDADPADDSYYLTEGQDGIRHAHLVDNTGMTFNAGGDALVDSDITSTLALMGKYAVDPQQLVMVTDVGTYLNGFLSSATGAPGNNVLTIDKFGNDAIVATGQLATYRGIPIVVSASYRETEADGKLSATPASNTLGGVSIFHKMMWYAGFMRDLLIEVDRDIQKRQYIMVSSIREAVAAHGTRSSQTHTAGIRNILN